MWSRMEGTLLSDIGVPHMVHSVVWNLDWIGTSAAVHNFIDSNWSRWCDKLRYTIHTQYTFVYLFEWFVLLFINFKCETGCEGKIPLKIVDKKVLEETKRRKKQTWLDSPTKEWIKNSIVMFIIEQFVSCNWCNQPYQMYNELVEEKAILYAQMTNSQNSI